MFVTHFDFQSKAGSKDWLDCFISRLNDWQALRRPKYVSRNKQKANFMSYVPFTVSLENNFTCYTHSIGINRISLKHAHCKSHTTNSTKIRWWKRTVIAANDKKMYNVPLCAEWWMFSAYFGIHPLCILNILWIGWMCLRYHSSRLDPLSHQVNWSRHQISRDPVQGGGHKIVTLPCCGKTAQLLRLEVEENSCAKQEGIFYFESTFLSPCQTLGQSWKKMLKTHRLKKREHEHK